jgi:hypothetical protein
MFKFIRNLLLTIAALGLLGLILIIAIIIAIF